MIDAELNLSLSSEGLSGERQPKCMNDILEHRGWSLTEIFVAKPRGVYVGTLQEKLDGKITSDETATVFQWVQRLHEGLGAGFHVYAFFLAHPRVGCRPRIAYEVEHPNVEVRGVEK